MSPEVAACSHLSASAGAPAVASERPKQENSIVPLLMTLEVTRHHLRHQAALVRVGVTQSSRFMVGRQLSSWKST